MEKYVIYVILTLLLSAVFTYLFISVTTPDITTPRKSKQYRSDYEYNHETDSFYKLHIVPYNQWHISRVCRTEGAELMNIDSEQDIIQLQLMLKKFPNIGEYVWVADDGKAHTSEHDLGPRKSHFHGLVVRRNGGVSTASGDKVFPFICKVKADYAPYDLLCGVYGTGYTYFESTGSCYKIPRLPHTWRESYSQCEAEGSHLVVINSMLEHSVVQNFTNTEEPVDAKTSWFFFAGFRADKPPTNTNTTAPPRVFKTIFNQTLEQAGYNVWTDGEPNNIKESEYCGTIYKNDGKFNDVNCDHEYPFICEKEVDSS